MAQPLSPHLSQLLVEGVASDEAVFWSEADPEPLTASPLMTKVRSAEPVLS